jgi:hypothetical protein
MQTHKTCNLCGTGSEDTAIFTCSYAKGELQICLGCLAEGILETLGQSKSRNPVNQMKNPDLDPMIFDLSKPDEVYGFSCESCSSIIFSEMFPVQCEHCQHINHQAVLQKNK